MDNLEFKYLEPLTDKEKELLFNSKIERLTPKEILDRYGDVLTEEEKDIINQLNNKQ